MPNPADILSLQDDEDPDDLLRMQLAQGQGANLAGAPQPPGAPTGWGGRSPLNCSLMSPDRSPPSRRPGSRTSN